MRKISIISFLAQALGKRLMFWSQGSLRLTLRQNEETQYNPKAKTEIEQKQKDTYVH